MAFGAAPTMLLFAPDGGAGFDFWGQDSFEKILTSWNSTNAGPLGPSGALNVIPHHLEGLMAVRATFSGRNGGIFETFAPVTTRVTHNSTSGTRTATEVNDSMRSVRLILDSMTARKAKKRAPGGAALDCACDSPG